MSDSADEPVVLVCGSMGGCLELTWMTWSMHWVSRYGLLLTGGSAHGDRSTWGYTLTHHALGCV